MNLSKNKNKLIITIVSTIVISSIVIGMSQFTAANLSVDQSFQTEMVSLSMSVTGETQGQLDDAELLTLNDGLVSPRDAASGLPTGKRQHKPVTVTKEIDKSTPLLMNVLSQNENLPEVIFRFYAQDATGVVVNYYTITLINSAIASIRHVVYEDPDTGGFKTVEQISFTFQKIIWTWEDGGITAEDDWEAPVV